MEDGRKLPQPRDENPESYALSGKIMLSAIVILFTVVLLIICLHIYARWFLIRARRRNQHLRRRTRRNHLVFTSDIPSNTVTVASLGLDASVLKSLPTFVYSTTTHDEVLECAVCLSEFEENEKGRHLPKCNHCFHIDCIDMWFHSHSTCPLCRASVKPEAPEPVTETPIEIVVDSAGSEPGTSSGLCLSCREDEDELGCASSSSSTSSLPVGSRRKPLELVGVSIEVPRRNESLRIFEEELQGSPGGQGFKSPGSRIRSLKRILSRKASMPSLSCSSATEIDLERGEEEEAQAQAQGERTRTT